MPARGEVWLVDLKRGQTGGWNWSCVHRVVSLAEFLVSPGRVAPDPITIGCIERRSLSFAERYHAAIVRFIPADGVERKPAICRAPIFQRSAADDIMRHLGDELRRKRVELREAEAILAEVTKPGV